MKSAILSVGTELLFGQITNTNTVFLSQQLNLLGFDVMYHYTVGDNPERLEDMIALAFKDCDLILTTGGLGPTQDDLTKEIVCRALDDHMVLHQPSMEKLESYFKKQNRQMTENNRKQAYMPSRAVVFDNDAGTAPGFALEKDGKQIICMPGPPREMTRMFERSVLPYLEKKSESTIYYRMIRTFGIGESMLETKLLPLIDEQTDPTLATYAKEGECCLRIASKRATKEEAKEAVDAMLEKVKAIIGEYIYSCDNEELVDVVSRKLLDRGLSISSAESCTGGMFAAALTSVSGISAVFDRSLVTYSNNAKMAELGVKEETLTAYGAVSEETAREMAEGLHRVSGSDICVSVTGIAGPEGGTAEKPVGLVYIGAHYQERTICRKIQMRNVNRNWNRNFAVLSMLDVVNKLI
ncbi:competence/damage-inducible protein A [Anaerovorax odorimutans]|uniref:Putative competence-damage inducible protein n=1 Tax=Anaerovorax odorimutans TaxID=109327 RepID=A0ABT1RKV5_9FIRM|nr:competence/damage-inducible protein A [Anaerovorax odorimutans]MCQ4635814.1 competence/damage-inducible protein A [Anaerovorax odorimutans]